MERLKMTRQTSDNHAPARHAQAARQLIFNLGDEFYAIPVLKVREIIRLLEITPIPQMPPFILGVINLRGKIIPVLDLRLRFGLAQAQTTQSTCIVVAHIKSPAGHTINMGLVVDGVEDVLNISPEDIEETPLFGAQLNTEFVPRIARVKGRVVALLDLDHLLLADPLETINQSIPMP